MTVREVIEALSRLPPHLPVVVTAHVDGDDVDLAYNETREISDVKWEGRYVELDGDGGCL